MNSARLGDDPGSAFLLGDRRHQQARSQQTAQAIVVAARESLKEKDFGELTVGEIAARAGTSVGGFYARFDSKSALLEVIMAAVMLEADEALDEFAKSSRGLSAAAVIRRWTKMMVRVFRTHQTEIRQFRLHLPQGPDSGGRLARETTRLRDRARGVFRHELSARGGEISHADPDSAIGIALMLGTVGLREAVVGNALDSYGAVVDDERLANEVASCMVKYLGLADE